MKDHISFQKMMAYSTLHRFRSVEGLLKNAIWWWPSAGLAVGQSQQPFDRADSLFTRNFAVHIEGA